MMDFDFNKIMGTPYMAVSAERYGRLMLAWIATIEVLKATVNRMEFQQGESTQTQWFNICDGWMLSDGCVIQKFSDLCAKGKIPEHEDVVQCLNEALRARHQLVHRLGKMITEYLIENREQILFEISEASIDDGTWAKPLAEKVEKEISNCEPVIATACNSVKSFATKTLYKHLAP